MTQQPAWATGLLEVASNNERERLLDSRPTEGLPDDVRCLAEEALRHVRVDVHQAEVLAKAAIFLADRQLDPFCHGLSRRALAHVRYLLASYEEARNLYAEAADSFRRSGDEVEVGKTLSSSLQVRILLGHYEQALAAAAEARRLFEEHDEELYLARLECNIGNLLHRQDRFAEAIERYESSLQVFRRLGSDPLAIAAALLNSGVCRIALDEFDQALDYFEQLRRHCVGHDLPLPAAQADYNIAYLHYRRGEYTRAIELYRTAEENCSASGDAYHQALCRLDLAELYLEVRLTEEGIRLATAANQTFAELSLENEASKALVFMALGALQENETVRSLELMVRARRGYEREGNLVWCAAIDLYRALILLDTGRAIETRRLAESALAIFLERGQAAKVIQCELLLARAELALGTADQARAWCASALERTDRLGYRSLLYQAHFVSAQIEEQAGNAAAALEEYRRAHSLLEGGPSHLRTDELKITLVRDKLEIYESLFWHSVMECSSSVPQEEVFSIVEDAKARGLADLIAFKAPSLPASRCNQSELVLEMRHLRQQLNWYSFRLDTEELGSPATPKASDGSLGSGDRIDELRDRGRQCEDRLLETLSQLRAEDRDFGSLQMGGGLDVEAVRASMPADATMLLYYQARGTIFGLTLDRGDLQVRPLTTVGKVHELQVLLQTQLSKFFLGAEYVEQFKDQLEQATNAHLRELYAELIAPLRRRLNGDQLIIVPHGSLHTIPFHALSGGASHLVDEFAVSYAPSASVYQMCCERAPRQAEGALLLGTSPQAGLALLDEIEAVRKCLPSLSVFVGEEATEAKLRDLGSQASLIHLAASGLSRRDNPMFTEIELADSRLALFDLYSLNLSSELVVLSGCGSSLTTVDNGDELISLTRGLLYAGAESVVATLWDSRSESTATFMGAFYRELERLDSRAVAMQRAMVEVRREFPQPFHWAPFFLTGKSSARCTAAADQAPSYTAAQAVGPGRAS